MSHANSGRLPAWKSNFPCTDDVFKSATIQAPTIS